MAFDSAQELVAELAKDLVAVESATEGGLVLVGVDGWDGAGKTTLAGQIAKRIGGKVLSLDPYLEGHRGGYVPNLRVDEIQREVGSASGWLIAEGVCLLAAADRIGIRLQKLIYVKRMSPSGFWIDQDVCDLGRARRGSDQEEGRSSLGSSRPFKRPHRTALRKRGQREAHYRNW